MAVENASSSRAAAAGGARSHGVANANLRPAREPEQDEAPARDGVANANLRPAREQEQQEAPAREGRAPEPEIDLMSFLPDATRSNGIFWPVLEVEDGDTPAE